MPEWLGKTIGNVRIDKLLAQGGMAEVYLGMHLTLERPVAIKFLHSYIEGEPLLLDRFHREAKVVAALRHPNIVQVFDFDAVDGHPFIVMEYLKGPTLATYLSHLHQRKKRIPQAQVARLLNRLADALDYAHGEGVIHRDIKPGNILLHNKSDEIPLDTTLSDDVEPIVTDFGLVRVMNAATQTMSGIVSGTPSYMSPEQARGDEIDHRTDFYSLGAVLYEMLAGGVPFQADNTVSVLHMHIHTPPPPIAGISSKVQAVIDRALAKNPNDRYQTGQEMADDFYRSIGIPEQAIAVGKPYPSKPVPIEVPPSGTPEAATWPQPQTVPEPPPTSRPQIEPEPLSKSQARPQSEPSPKSQPRIEPATKPARSWIWVGAGLFSLICLGLLVFGATRLLSAGTFLPKSTEISGPIVPSAPVSPQPSEALNLASAEGMVQVPADTYEVGTPLFTDDYHAPPQKIPLDSFWIDQYLTTNAQYQLYMTETGAPEPVTWPGEENHPVIGVTWDQALAYCQWTHKRLPKEAEWEAAGRGPGSSPQLYPWGNDSTAGGQALALPDEDTYPVGTQSFNKSPTDVFDMVGNVWEWVGESYANNQEGIKVLRGGRYGLPINDLAYRLVVAPGDTRYIKYAGFRCAADQVK
jgi:serine/threonine protein kinase